jgi:hypothetical protein
VCQRIGAHHPNVRQQIVRTSRPGCPLLAIGVLFGRTVSNLAAVVGTVFGVWPLALLERERACANDADLSNYQNRRARSTRPHDDRVTVVDGWGEATRVGTELTPRKRSGGVRCVSGSRASETIAPICRQHGDNTTVIGGHVGQAVIKHV